jgi:hypothetical protein
MVNLWDVSEFPKKFYQILTVHFELLFKKFTGVYVLLKNKTKYLYNRVFNVLNVKFNLVPKIVVVELNKII